MIARLTQSARRLAAALRRQEGVTMIILLGVMLVTSLLVIAAFTSANGEIHLTASDTAQKKAYYAAEAGLEDYEYHLTQDGNYLGYCTTPTPANPALNQYYKEGSETEPLKSSELKTAEVPELEGKSSEEKYAIQLLPAESDKLAGDRKCDPNHLVETMVEEQGAATGTFRIESTGFSGNEKRSLVATFKNANFVSFVWYTMYEVGDPVVDGEVPAGKPSTYWTECGNFYEQREKLAEKRCKWLNNFFGPGESINGPVHVQDHAGVCGEPTFGRNATDRIEFGDGEKLTEATTGYSNEGQCGAANPNFKGTHIPPKEVPTLEPPPGDQELEHIVEAAYHFYGRTEVILQGTVMAIRTAYKENPITKKLEYSETTNVPYPPNGVIYVSGGTGGGCPTFSPFGPVPGYNEGLECGDVYVHGKYEDSLTIAAENNVIINENITTLTESAGSPDEGAPTTNAMLGLIANNFVRVYHPVSKTYTKTASSKCKEEAYVSSDGVSHKIPDKTLSSTECEYTNEVHLYENASKEWEVVDACDAPNAPEDLNGPIIYAAMLAVDHAVIVDNFDCGAPTLGHLNVYGALAGLFSDGLTGEISGTTVIHGYAYNANYDNRLQVEEPPHFLNPIQAAWYIQRQTLASNP
jgi:Tfp pilus assembly protein PilX